jgi:hypothetical protein
MGPSEGSGGECLAGFRAQCSDGLGRIGRMLEDLKESEEVGLAPLMVAVRASADQCESWSKRA